MAHVFRSEAAKRLMYEQLGRFQKRDEFYRDYDEHGPDGPYPSISETVVEELKAIRATLHLRWNNRAVASGKQFEGRWEIWDVEPQEHERYLVRTIYTPKEYFSSDGTSLGIGKDYREPNMQDVEFFRAQERLFAKYDGDMEKVINELVDVQNEAMANATEADASERIGQLILDLARFEIPKVGYGTTHHGKRAFSA